MRATAKVLSVLVLCAGAAQGIEWVRRYNGTANGHDRAAALALDSAGACYVAGYVGGAGRDFAVRKYSSAGDSLWLVRLTSSGSNNDEARALAFDGRGNIVATGYATVGAPDYYTVQINCLTGETLWTRRYSGPANGEDRAAAVAADDSGNVYVTGTAQMDAGSQALTVKYNRVGLQIWARAVTLPGGDSASGAVALALDAARNSYICGRVRDTAVSTEHDFLVAKLTPNGALSWARRYNGPAGRNDYATALALDPAGNVWVTGASQGSGTGLDYTTIKYSPTGQRLWTARYGNAGSGADVPSALVIDSAGNGWVTGFSAGATGWDYLTIKYSPDGETLWTRRHNGPGGGNDSAAALALDRAGNCYVAGFSTGSSRDARVVVYSPDGEELWAVTYDGPAGGDDAAVAVAAGRPGTFHAAGYSRTSANNDWFTMKCPEVDAAVLDLVAPRDTLPPMPLVPTARVRNCGVRPASFTVYATVFDGEQVTWRDSTVVNELGPDIETTVRFGTLTLGQGSYALRCSTVLAGDLNPANDAAEAAFTLAWTSLPGWNQRRDLPGGLRARPVKDGGALCAGRVADRECIWALKGNNTGEFYRFDIAADTWARLETLGVNPARRKSVKKGGALAADDSSVYALKGNNTQEFWRYCIAGDSWRALADVPLGPSRKKPKGGAGLAFGITDSGEARVYALKGNRSNEFWAYRVAADSWLQCPDVPPGGTSKGLSDGSASTCGNGAVWVLKGGTNEFYRYLPDQGTWETLEPMPMFGPVGGRRKAKAGTSIAFAGDRIYALKGGTADLWCYWPEARTWTALDPMPTLPSGRYTKAGGAICYAGGAAWALKGNKTMEFWRYEPGMLIAGRLAQPGMNGMQGRSEIGNQRLAVLSNPSRGSVTIRWQSPIGSRSSTLTLYDASGRLAHRRTLDNRQATFDIPLSPGVYLLRVTGGANLTRKLVVE